MYKDSTLPQQDKVNNYARLRNTHLEHHGKEKKRKEKEGEDTKRVKRPRTTEAQRAVARTLVKKGYTQLEAARRTKILQASVSNAIKKFKETGGDGNRKSKQNGRPRISTDRDDRFLTRTSLRDRFKPATKLKEEWEKIGVNASVSTIRRRLRAANLSGPVARKKPYLTIAHKRRRLDFAKKHKNWSKEEWELVLWTDESPFSIFGECGKRYVRRRPGEEFNPECVTPIMKHGGGKIQVWGCFTARALATFILLKVSWIRKCTSKSLFITCIHHCSSLEEKIT